MERGRRELEFVGIIGRGGFGAVYLANLRTGSGLVRPVAVKVMKAGLEAEPELLARQRDEARLLGRINHDGFVKVLELTTVDGRPAVVMDYVVGADGSEVLANAPGRRLPVGPALEIVAAAAGALDAAWNGLDPITGAPLRVVHRDIKPANLLLTADGAVKVLDFGIARAEFAEREGQTRSNFFGTPRFMAPEQWTGAHYGGEVDVYALGATLYELVSGRRWERCPQTASAYRVQQADLLAAAPDLDPGVRALIAEMTAFEGAERPTAADVRRRAVGLATEVGGERLVAFAAVAVPPVVKARKLDPAGEALPERHTLSDASLAPTQTATLRPPTPPPSRGIGMGLAGVAVGVVLAGGLAVVVGIGAWLVLSPTEEPPPAPEPITLAPPVNPPAVAAPDPAPDALPAADAAPSPSPDPAPRAKPSRATHAAAATPAEPAPAPAPEVVTYELQVTSEPIGADVTVDGAPAGRTPNARARLAAGSHHVALTLGDQHAEKDVTVSADGAKAWRYRFTEGKWYSIH